MRKQCYIGGMVGQGYTVGRGEGEENRGGEKRWEKMEGEERQGDEKRG